MELVRRSSSIVRLVAHVCFKVNYCHKIFDDKRVEQRCAELLCEAAYGNGMRIGEMGFDRDHIHLEIDLGLKSVPEMAKLLKDYSAKVLLDEFPHLKRQYFWDSGLWSPTVYVDSIGERTSSSMQVYIRQQGSQARLADFHRNTAGL